MTSEGDFARFTPQAVKGLAAEPGTWSPLRADFEDWLLRLIEDDGLEGLRQGVQRLNGLGFAFREESATESQLTLSSPLLGTETAVRIVGSLTAATVSADVSIVGPAETPAPPDPRHQRFYALYDTWTIRRAKFLVATVKLLRQMDVPETRRVLEEASRLIESKRVAAADAWDVLTPELAELDEAFFRAGEDVSGAVIDAFSSQTGPERSSGPGPS